jgi:hypothetical protein
VEGRAEEGTKGDDVLYIYVTKLPHPEFSWAPGPTEPVLLVNAASISEADAVAKAAGVNPLDHPVSVVGPKPLEGELDLLYKAGLAGLLPLAA